MPLFISPMVELSRICPFAVQCSSMRAVKSAPPTRFQPSPNSLSV